MTKAKSIEAPAAAKPSGFETELSEIKRLLILLLLKCGSTQSEIAEALKIDRATVSRKFRFGKLKPLQLETVDGDGRPSVNRVKDVKTKR